MKVENRELAEFQWAYIDSLHSKGFRDARCWIPGKRKLWIRCPDTVPCTQCPHKTNRKSPVISWDVLCETGYEPATAAPVAEQVVAKMEWQEVRTKMDAEDIRIAQAFEAKELCGDSVKLIALRFGISEPRVYQLLARAKAIAKEYRSNIQ